MGLLLVFFMILVASCGNLFTVYLRQEVKVEASWFQLFSPALSLGAMGGSFLLGWMTDSKGLRAAYATAFTAGLISMILIHLSGKGYSAFSFAGIGFLESAFPVLNLSLVLKLATLKKDTSVQVGLFHTLMSPWNFLLPLAVGWLASRAGYAWVFALGALFA